MGAIYTKSSVSAARQYVQAKARIMRAQGKAKAIGLLYLLAMLIVTAIACLPLMALNEKDVTFGVMNFWKPFTRLSEGFRNIAFDLVAAVVYGVMLLILLINLLKAFGKLGWLFKKKASRLYGFNRNMYAMDDIGRFFSSSLAAVIVCHFLIIVLSGVAFTLSFLAYVLLAVGVVAHFACGLFAGNVSLFSTEGVIVEEKRELGNFSPFVRSLLQIVATFAMAFFFAPISNVFNTFATLVKEGGVKELLENPMGALVPAAIHVLILAWLIVMFAYAFGTTEFDMEGKDAAGRKTYLVFSILMFLTTVGAFVFAKLVLKTEAPMQLLIIAAIAFVMIIMEIVLLRYPQEETENLDEVDPGTYLTENYDLPGVYLTPAAAQAMTYGAEAIYAESRRK